MTGATGFIHQPTADAPEGHETYEEPRPRPAAAGRRRSQARGRATRARLLDSAEELFTQKGYDGTSIGDVAMRTGIGVGTVYHHFPDKRAILLELIDRWGDRLDGSPKGEQALADFLGDDAEAAIAGWLRAQYLRLRAQPSLYLVALAVAGRDPEVGRRYRRIEQANIDHIGELIRYGQSAGLMRAGLCPETAAFLVHHTLDTAARELLLRRDLPDEEAQQGDSVVDGLADMLCRYLVGDDED